MKRRESEGDVEKGERGEEEKSVLREEETGE